MRSYNKHIALFFLMIFALAGCSGEWSHYPQQTAIEQRSADIINVGDTVYIDVFDQSALTGSYIISNDGAISLPLLRSIVLTGLTAEEASDKIEAKLIEQEYLINPKVTISLSQSQIVMILGEVMEGGEYTFKDGMTILDLVAKSGGFTYRANQNLFDIIRKNQDSLDLVIDGYLSTRLQPGDLVRVKERYF